jgi:hypothetical protein
VEERNDKIFIEVKIIVVHFWRENDTAGSRTVVMEVFGMRVRN